MRIPGEVLDLIGVFDIQPDDVVRDMSLVKPPINVLDVVFGEVIPSALVVAEGKLLRHSGCSRQLAILLRNVLGRGAQEDKEIDDTALGDPVGLGVLWGTGGQAQRVSTALDLGDINPRIGGIEPQETDGRILSVSLHERDGAVEGHGAVKDILEDVGVVHAIGFCIVAFAASSLLERKRSRMLGNTIDVLVSMERDVQGHTFGATWLGIGMSVKRFVPPSAFVLLGVFFSLWSLDLWSPMLNIEQAAFVELDVRDTVSPEINPKGRESDDGLKVAFGTVFDIDLRVVLVDNLGFQSRLKAANNGPVRSLVVAFLSCGAAVPQLNVLVLPPLFVNGEASNTRFEE